MFGVLSVPFDFFHIGLLIVVIMIVITGLVILVSVIGVCCFHWLEGLERGGDEEGSYQEESCQYNRNNQSVHVIVLPDMDNKGLNKDPSQLRDHFQRIDTEFAMRRFLHDQSHLHQEPTGPPPSYEVLYPPNQQPPVLK